jgi:hypothetical protein
LPISPAATPGSLLDAPCGDYNWMQRVEWPADFRYVGADIIHHLIIIENRENHPGIEFVELDVLRIPSHASMYGLRAISIFPIRRSGPPGTISPLADHLSASDDLPQCARETPT